MESFFLGHESPRYSCIDDTLKDDDSDSEKSDRAGHSRHESDHLCLQILCWKPKRQNIPRPTWWLWLNLSLLGLSTIILIVSLWVRSLSMEGQIPRNSLLKQTSIPSPILDAIDIAFGPRRMDATLLQSEPINVFRREPSREVDLAWWRITDTKPIPLSRADVLAIGKDPAQAVKFPESWGLGPETYAGRVDVFHQIHCLDALRREAYFDYYYGKKYPGGFNETTKMHKLHLSHCIYLLLQNIMCNANTDVYTHIWTDTLDHPFPDFNINHQCRDFESILDWQKKNGINENEFVALKKPEDYGPAHVMNHRFKELHGYFRNHPDDGDLTSGEIG